jgi:drug/metabolite transporter (DMT)-like permease
MAGLFRVVIGALVSVVGVVWILQGSNVIHSSSMSGHSSYTALGVVLLVIGAALLGWEWRRRRAT